MGRLRPLLRLAIILPSPPYFATFPSSCIAILFLQMDVGCNNHVRPSISERRFGLVDEGHRGLRGLTSHKDVEALGCPALSTGLASTPLLQWPKFRLHSPWFVEKIPFDESKLYSRYCIGKTHFFLVKIRTSDDRTPNVNYLTKRQIVTASSVKRHCFHYIMWNFEAVSFTVFNTVVL